MQPPLERAGARSAPEHGKVVDTRIFPPIYPWSAFDSRRWIEAHRGLIVPHDLSERVGLHCQTEALKCRLLSESDRVNFDRVGILQGDFVPLDDGLMLIDREGGYLMVNFPAEPNVGYVPYNKANRRDVWDYAQSVRDVWDQIPVIENAAIFSHAYATNYYHFCLEFLQKFRLIEPFDVTTIAMPSMIYEGGVYRELIERVLGRRIVVATNQPMRLRNPVVAEAHQSDEALRWLRHLAGETVQPQGRRYYIRRSPLIPRVGNNISENADFLEFLRRHSFEVVDFGNGELPVREQIGKLKGASIILAAHGAGLTNLAYLNAPVRIIEVFSRSVIAQSFMQISAALGFEHHAIISEQLDGEANVVVDCDLLDRLVSAEVASRA
ncbi:MAG: glycosyltransferase family 61 protein [Caulobacteraceae bacterium]|nr:glycosyltransferase family 61 protein [Caulobacteraceae bacterium]